MNNRTHWLIPALALLAVAFSPAPGFAAPTPIAASAIFVEGDAKYVSVKDRQTYRIKVGVGFGTGDRIVTGPASAVEIEFATGDRIRVGESSDLTIKSLSKADDGSTSSVFDLALGRVRSFVSKLAGEKSEFEYHTRVAIVGVAGTDFVTELPDRDTLSVYVLPEGDAAEKLLGGEPEGDTQICADSALWTAGAVYVKGRDPAGTVVNVTSCKMTTVVFGKPPLAASVIPNGVLRGLRRTLPFVKKGATGGERTMLDNITRRVSVPLMSTDPLDDDLQRLDDSYQQGQGLNTRGGGHNAAPQNNSVVRGSVTINISQ